MTSNLKPKADRRKKATDTSSAVTIAAGAEPISRADIARKAYEFYLARGGQNGSEVDDWLRAERELMSAPVPPPKRTTRKPASH